MSEIIAVAVGWVLGILSSLVLEEWKEHTRRNAIGAAVRVELRESAYRFAVLVYTLERNQGRMTRETLQWVQSAATRYEGPNPSEGVLSGLAGLLKSSDEQLTEFVRLSALAASPSFLPTEHLTYTTAVAHDLHGFSPKYAVRVLDVLAHVRMYNEAREQSLYYSRLTFTPQLGSDNHAAAVRNARQAEEQACKRARIIVDKISKLETDFP